MPRAAPHRPTLLLCLALATGCGGAGAREAFEAETVVIAPALPPGASVEPRPARPPRARLHDPVDARVRHARGLYIHGPFVDRFGAKGVIAAVRDAHLDTAVIDLKDGQGRVTYRTAIPALQGQRFTFIDDPAALVRELRAAGIHTIGRVVCFSDPIMPHRFPERAILDGRPRREGRVWQSWGTAGAWLDPTLDVNQELVVELAREAEAFGFDEVQLDYVRFPVDEAAHHAVIRGFRGRTRVQVLLDLLEKVDAAIAVPLGADVFGLTAFREGDPSGLGQDLEAWTPYVEIFSPMLYLNAMKTWGLHLDRRGYELIKAGVGTLRGRVGQGPVIRPFLQAFRDGRSNFSPQVVRDQIRGARDGGADGYLFWHPGSSYGDVFAAMARPGRGALRRPFPAARASARTSAPRAVQ